MPDRLPTVQESSEDSRSGTDRRAKRLLPTCRVQPRIGGMADRSATYVLLNASIACHPEADALAVRGGRISAIGSAENVTDAHPGAVECIDMKGGFVLPGFIDAHTHIFTVGLAETGYTVDLANRSRSEVLELLHDAADARSAGEWVVGVGWDESTWKDHRWLSKTELDAVALRSPMIAVRLDGHLLTANGQALAAYERLGRTDRAGFVDGEQGVLREEAAWALIDSIEPDHAALADALHAATRLCHRLGITSVHVMTEPRRIPVLIDRAGMDPLRIRFYSKVLSVEDVRDLLSFRDLAGEWLTFGGAKLFTDGSIGARNAAVSVPYTGGGTGALNFADDELRDIVAFADANGMQTAIHAIGDRAIEQVLKVHSGIDTDPSNRHRIEHLELPTQEQVRRAGECGLWLSMQPNFIANWSGDDSMYVERIGRDRDALSNPLRWVADEGVPIAFGSDGMPMSALYGLHAAVNPPYDVQALSLDEALAAYTSGGARLAGQDDIGVLRVGARADLVVLDADPEIEPERIGERSVMQTYVDGRCVYAKDTSRNRRNGYEQRRAYCKGDE